MRTRLFSVVLILVLLAAALTSCSSKVEPTPAASLHVVLATPFATEDAASALRDALVAAAPELDNEAAPLSVTFVSTGDTEKDPMGAMAGMTQLSAKFMSNELELLVCDADNARRHGDNGATYIPLSELFTEAELSEMGAIPATLPIIDESGNLTDERTDACGIDLSGLTSIVQMLGIRDPGAYVIVDSPNTENAKIAIRALLTK